jgi:hypothetical protein
MKKESRKLNLNRETLIPLQGDDLDKVNGGTSPATTITTSSMPCLGASAASVASIADGVHRYFQSRGCPK